MDYKHLVRDPARVKANLVKLADVSLVAKVDCKIYFPARYAERYLAEISADNRVAGLFALVMEDKYYSVCNVCAMIKLNPTTISKVKFNEEDYYEFFFPKGSTISPSLDLVKNDVLVYRIYDEYFSKANIPWYFNYEDMGFIFLTAKKHANANVGEDPKVTQLLVSLIGRTSADKTLYYRAAVKNREEMLKTPPAFIPLKSVTYAATNTTSKLGGSYFDVGVRSALVNPSDRVEKIEQILRR